MTFAVTELSHVDTAVTHRRRYLLLPPAGATLAALRHVADAAPGERVWGVEYPGRALRVDDQMPSTLAGLAEQVARELAERFGPRVIGDLVLVGFSMGAFVALEVVWHAQARFGVAPRALVVVGAVAPQRRTPGRYARSDRAALAEVLERDGLAREFRGSPEAWDYVLELLRGDLRLATGYTRHAIAQVPCPLAALCGADDPGVGSVDDATGAWRPWTAGPFTVRVVAGGHLGLLTAGRGNEFWALVRGLDETITAVTGDD